jgi:hypothetical protein
VNEETPGFLGSTSFSEVFKANRHASDDIWLQPLAHVKSSLRSHPTYTLQPDRINSGAEILGLFTDFKFIKRIIVEYHNVSPTAIPPWITLNNSLDSLQETLQGCKTAAQRQFLAERIFTQTFIPLKIDESANAANFHLSFTGDKLRWEILGVLFTYLALGSLLDNVEPQSACLERQQYTRELTKASNLCVSFCDRSESLNDVLVWLLHSNTILLTFQYGDARYVGISEWINST